MTIPKQNTQRSNQQSLDKLAKSQEPKREQITSYFLENKN